MKEPGLHRWPASPLRLTHVRRERTGRQGDPMYKHDNPPPCWCVLEQDTEGRSLRSWAWPLTSPRRAVDKRSFLPMGINKVSHYHLNAADCIYVSLHFSLRTFYCWNVWYDHVTVMLLYHLLGKDWRPKCQMIKEQSATLCASQLPIPLSVIQSPIYYSVTPLCSYFFCCLGATFRIF